MATKSSKKAKSNVRKNKSSKAEETGIKIEADKENLKELHVSEEEEKVDESAAEAPINEEEEIVDEEAEDDLEF